MRTEDLEVTGGRIVAKGLWTRLNAHASGRRSGDQFCVFIGDRFCGASAHPVPAATARRGALSLDSLIRGFVRERLGYRFILTADEVEAAKLEQHIRRGVLSAGKPYLNPLSRGGSTLTSAV